MSIAQAALRQVQAKQKRKPTFVARAKVNGGWITIGAAWPFKSGEEGLSIKLQSIPVNFDGTFILLPPLPNDEVPEEPAEVQQG